MKKKMWKQLTAAAAVAVMVGTACAGTAFAEEDNGMVRSYLTGKLVPEIHWAYEGNFCYAQ